MLHRLLCENRSDRRHDQCLVLHPQGIAGKARIVGPFRMTQLAPEFDEQSVVGSSDHHLAVAGGECLEHHHPRIAAAVPFGLFAGGGEARHHHLQPAHRGLKQRGIDHAADAGAVALEQCRNATQRRPDAGAEVEHLHADP